MTEEKAETTQNGASDSLLIGRESNSNEQKDHLRSSSHSLNYLQLDADKVLSAFGRFGKYQMLTYFITTSVHILFAINMMVMPFITEDPKFYCQINEPEGANWEYTVVDKCTILDGNNWTTSCLNIPGASYNYSDVHSSLASEFNLVCEDYDYVEHGTSIFMLGGMLIAPIITQLSDLFGRRITFLAPLYVAVASNLICAFAPNFTIFLVFRFVAGVASTGFFSIGYVLCLESVSVEFRSLVPFLGNITWVVGYILAGVFKLFISNWRMLYLAVSIPGLLTIPFYWFTPESLHWLITKKRHIGVEKYILSSMRYDRLNTPLLECQSSNDLAKESLKKKRTVVDIFTTPILFVSLMLNAYILVVMNGTYWALSLFSTDLSEDKMLGFFLSGIVELPAGLVATALIWYLPRKTVSFFSLFFQSISMICALYLPVSPSIAMVFPLLAKCFNTIVWSSQPLLFTESTPTSVRNVFCGVASFLGDFGSVLAPYLKRLEAVHQSAPAMLIALMSMVAAVIVLTLPETKDKKLPEDIDDIDPGPVFGCLVKKRKSTETASEDEEKISIPMEETTMEEKHTRVTFST